jgi:hypothetical protein
VRPLVIIYHLTAELDPAIRAAIPANVRALNITLPVVGAHHPDYSLSAGAIAPLSQILGDEQARTESQFSPVVVVGFSAGGKGPREQILAGQPLDGTVCIDGSHATAPPDDLTQLEPWRLQLRAARSCARAAIWTHTQIQTEPPILSTRSTLELVTGLDLATDTPRASLVDGCARVYSYPGRDAAAHVHQAREVLPAKLSEILAILRGESPAPSAGTASTGEEAQPTAAARAIGAAASVAALAIATVGARRLWRERRR